MIKIDNKYNFGDFVMYIIKGILLELIIQIFNKANQYISGSKTADQQQGKGR